MRCPTCQTRNYPGSRFCINCGAPLVSMPAPPTRPARRWLRLGMAVASGLIIGVAAFALYWYFGPQLIGETIALGTEGGTLNLADGTQLTVPPEGIDAPLLLRVKTVPVAQLRRTNPEVDQQLAYAAGKLSSHNNATGAVYGFDVLGPLPTMVIFSTPFAGGHAYTLDLYAWNGASWHWLPARVDPSAGALVARLDSLPMFLALIQVQPTVPIVTIGSLSEMTTRFETSTTVSEVLLPGFVLQPDGSIKGNPIVPEASSDVVFVPSLRNWRDDGTLTARLDQILGSPVSRRRHFEAVVGLALSGGFSAIQLDYRGLRPAERQAYSAFITEVAAALHQQDRILIVRVEASVQVSASRWGTGAYDWTAIGQAADRIQVPLALDGETMAQGQVVTQLIWAVGQVERYKLQVVASLRNLDKDVQVNTPTLTSEALAHLGPLQPTSVKRVRAGSRVTFFLTGLRNEALEVDPVSGVLTYGNAGQRADLIQFRPQPVTSLRGWLQQIARFHLAGVLLENLDGGSADVQLWQILKTYQTAGASLLEDEFAWVWTVTKTDAPAAAPLTNIQSLADSSFVWTTPQLAGTYRIAVALSMDGGASILPVASRMLRVDDSEVVSETDTPTPYFTPTIIPERSTTYQLLYTKWDGRFHNVYLADSASQRTRLILTRAAGPSWSPDKKQLFFVGEQGVDQQIRGDNVACEFGTISEGIAAIDLRDFPGDICEVRTGPWLCERKTIDVQATPSDVCTADEISVYQNLDWKVGSARWTSPSPDGEAVAFDAKPGGDYRIYFRAMMGSSQQFRIEFPGEQGSWSPDGQQMVYRSGRDYKQGLWISNRDDSVYTRITEHSSDAFPAWSPDGRTIAFSREIGGDVEIFTVQVDGSRLQRLTYARGPDTLPVYTPAGEIIFRSARSGRWGIWKMSGTGAEQTEIIPNTDVGPDWAYSRMDVK